MFSVCVPRGDGRDHQEQPQGLWTLLSRLPHLGSACTTLYDGTACDGSLKHSIPSLYIGVQVLAILVKKRCAEGLQQFASHTKEKLYLLFFAKRVEKNLDDWILSHDNL